MCILYAPNVGRPTENSKNYEFDPLIFDPSFAARMGGPKARICAGNLNMPHVGSQTAPDACSRNGWAGQKHEFAQAVTDGRVTYYILHITYYLSLMNHDL